MRIGILNKLSEHNVRSIVLYILDTLHWNKITRKGVTETPEISHLYRYNGIRKLTVSL